MSMIGKSKMFHDIDSASYASDDISGSTIGSFSKSRKLAGAAIWFKWTSSRDFLLFTTVCFINIWCYSAVLKNMNKREDAHPNIIHFVLVFFLLGLPLIYMQVSIGQYTQRGMIFIKEMCPIAHGTAYTVLLSIFVRCVNIGISMAIVVIYVLSSLSSNLQWLICPEITNEICWNSQSNCTKECLGHLVPSARLYYVISHLGLGEYSNERESGQWMLTKLLPPASCWVLLIVCLGYTKISYRKLIVIFLFTSMLLFGIVCAGCMLTNGGFKFTSNLITLSTNQYLSIDAWTLAVHESFQLLNIGRSLYIVTGTFLAPKAHSGLLSISATIIAYVVVLLMSFLALSSFGILQTFSSTSDKAMKMFWFFTQDEAVFAIIPQSFDFMSVPHFWSFAFFSSALLMQMNCLIVHIIILEKCITDVNPKLQRYRMYTTLVIATLICFTCIVFYRNASSYEDFASVVLAADFCELINTTIIILVVCVLYGVQKLCDDIHFMTGNPPTAFWKIGWYLMPVFYSLFTCLSIKYHLAKVRLRTGQKPKAKVVFISLGIFILPTILFAVIRIWVYMKRKNLVGLFKATEMYGSADPEDRHLRKVYNPRTEIKSKRRNDTCAHRCFISSRVFRKLVQEEQREEPPSETSLSTLSETVLN